MDIREKRILKKIVDQYIKTAQPVSSKKIACQNNLTVSSATIRQVMYNLEQQKLICQPHTSAGRIPTEQGYQYYVDYFLKNKTLELNKQKLICPLINEIFKTKTQRRKIIKNLAKLVSKISQTAVLISFALQDTYYTGLSFLFNQPEFKDLNLIRIISQVVDHLDSQILKLLTEQTNLNVLENNPTLSTIMTKHNITDKKGKKDNQELQIVIGNNNPLGNDLSAFVGRIKEQEMSIILLGPMRMNYQKNLNLMNYIITTFKHC